MTTSSSDGQRRRSRSTGSAQGGVRPARSDPPEPAQTLGGASGHRAFAVAAADRFRSGIDLARRRLRRTAPRIVGLALFVVIVGALALPSILRSEAGVSGTSRGIGSVDFSYQAAGVKAPTGRKPEAAKLWVHDGSWWGVLFDRSRDAYMIFRFDWEADTWVPTGTMIDDRNASRADVISEGRYLYVVSGGIDPTSAKHRAVLSRYSFDPARREYRLDAGFPFAISEAGAETFVVDIAQDGRLWVTYTRGSQVYVTHSIGSDRDWMKPFPLPIQQSGDLTPDDISAVVAFDGGVGIMWSDQKDGAMYFASHRDGDDDDTWQFSTAIQGPGLADDHMNLKALHDDPAGQVFAVIKTSINDSPDADPDRPLVMVLVLKRDGTWDQHLVGRVADDQTRPLLLIDAEHRQLIVFVSAPCCSGGQIYFKSSSLDKIRFTYGLGTPFMDVGPNGKINNPTSTRQNLGSETDLLVIASDDESNRYLHNVLYLRGPKVEPPTTASGPVPAASAAPGIPVANTHVLFEDGFESGGLDRWTTVKEAADGFARAEEHEGRSDAWGGHLAATAAKGSTASARFQLAKPAPVLAVGLDVRFAAEGPEGGNAPILRFFDDKGERLATIYRQNRRSDRVWVGHGEVHDATDGTIEMQTWARVEAQLAAASSGSVLSVRIDGQLVYQAAVPFGVDAVRDIQIGNDSKGQMFDLFVDNVKVQG